jgi:hypothetical protein
VVFDECTDPVLRLPFVVVGQAFDEKQRENVGFLVFNLTAQAGVGHSPREIAELLFGEHGERR